MARLDLPIDAPRLADYGAIVYALTVGEDVEAEDAARAMKDAGRSLDQLNRDVARARRAALAAAVSIVAGASSRGSHSPIHSVRTKTR